MTVMRECLVKHTELRDDILKIFKTILMSDSKVHNQVDISILLEILQSPSTIRIKIAVFEALQKIYGKGNIDMKSFEEIVVSSNSVISRMKYEDLSWKDNLELVRNIFYTVCVGIRGNRKARKFFCNIGLQLYKESLSRFAMIFVEFKYNLLQYLLEFVVGTTNMDGDITKLTQYDLQKYQIVVNEFVFEIIFHLYCFNSELYSKEEFLQIIDNFSEQEVNLEKLHLLKTVGFLLDNFKNDILDENFEHHELLLKVIQRLSTYKLTSFEWRKFFLFLRKQPYPISLFHLINNIAKNSNDISYLSVKKDCFCGIQSSESCTLSPRNGLSFSTWFFMKLDSNSPVKKKSSNTFTFVEIFSKDKKNYFRISFQKRGYVTLRASIKSKAVVFKKCVIPENKWTHVVVTMTKSTLLQRSSIASLYVNGILVQSEKISVKKFFSSKNESSFEGFYARHESIDNSVWKMGYSFLYEENIKNEYVKSIYVAGPSYCGLYLANYIPKMGKLTSHFYPKFFEMLSERNVGTVSAKELNSDKFIFSCHPKHVKKGKSSYDFEFVELSKNINSQRPKITISKECYVFNPNSFSRDLLVFDGLIVIFFLIERALNSKYLSVSLSILKNLIDNPVMYKEVRRIKGYDILDILLRKNVHIVDEEVLNVLWEMILYKGLISNALALQKLIFNFRIWKKTSHEIQKKVLIKLQSVIKNKVNRSRLKKLRITYQLLQLLEEVDDDIIDSVINCLRAVIHQELGKDEIFFITDFLMRYLEFDKNSRLETSIGYLLKLIYDLVCREKTSEKFIFEKLKKNLESKLIFQFISHNVTPSLVILLLQIWCRLCLILPSTNQKIEKMFSYLKQGLIPYSNQHDIYYTFFCFLVGKTVSYKSEDSSFLSILKNDVKIDDDNITIIDVVFTLMRHLYKLEEKLLFKHESPIKFFSDKKGEGKKKYTNDLCFQIIEFFLLLFKTSHNIKNALKEVNILHSLINTIFSEAEFSNSYNPDLRKTISFAGTLKKKRRRFSFKIFRKKFTDSPPKSLEVDNTLDSSLRKKKFRNFNPYNEDIFTKTNAKMIFRLITQILIFEINDNPRAIKTFENILNNRNFSDVHLIDNFKERIVKNIQLYFKINPKTMDVPTVLQNLIEFSKIIVGMHYYGLFIGKYKDTSEFLISLYRKTVKVIKSKKSSLFSKTVEKGLLKGFDIINGVLGEFFIFLLTSKKPHKNDFVSSVLKTFIREKWLEVIVDTLGKRLNHYSCLSYILFKMLLDEDLKVKGYSKKCWKIVILKIISEKLPSIYNFKSLEETNKKFDVLPGFRNVLQKDDQIFFDWLEKNKEKVSKYFEHYFSPFMKDNKSIVKKRHSQISKIFFSTTKRRDLIRRRRDTRIYNAIITECKNQVEKFKTEYGKKIKKLKEKEVIIRRVSTEKWKDLKNLISKGARTVWWDKQKPIYVLWSTQYPSHEAGSSRKRQRLIPCYDKDNYYTDNIVLPSEDSKNRYLNNIVSGYEGLRSPKKITDIYRNDFDRIISSDSMNELVDIDEDDDDDDDDILGEDIKIKKYLEAGDSIVSKYNCFHISGLDGQKGIFLMCKKNMYILSNFIKEKEEIVEMERGENEDVPHYCIKIGYNDLYQVLQRRYIFQLCGLEFFTIGGTHFVIFDRNEMKKVYNAIPSTKKKKLKKMTSEWQNRNISNFEYLMYLNTLAGRTYNDLTQYPIFPWVLSDYSKDVLDLDDPKSFRDFSKPMGALTEKRRKLFTEKYTQWEDGKIPKFHYGTHYSSAAIVLHYLIRIEPYTTQNSTLQGGKLDLPDRLFNNVHSTWLAASSECDVKECIPEFYCFPEFLMNINHLDFGTTQLNQVVDDVLLPEFANEDHFEFIRLHRKALENEYVSENLHHWIDLIFGFKTRGEEAVKAQNVFYYLTYPDSIDIEEIEDPIKKKAVISQIMNFGQVPILLFNKSHPKRKPPTNEISPIFDPSSLQIEMVKKVNYEIGGVSKNSGLLITIPSKCQFSYPKKDKYFQIHNSFEILSLNMNGVEGYKPAKTWKNPHGSSVECFRVSKDGKFVIFGGSNSMVSVWKIQKRNYTSHIVLQKRLCGHYEKISCLSVSVSYGVIVTGSYDKSIIIWDLKSNFYVSEMKLDDVPKKILINHDNGNIIASTDRKIYIWSINGRQITSSLDKKLSSNITSIGVIYDNEWSDRNLVVSGHGDGKLIFWEFLWHGSLESNKEKGIKQNQLKVREVIQTPVKSKVNCIYVTKNALYFSSGSNLYGMSNKKV